MPCYDFAHVTELGLIPEEILSIPGSLGVTGSEYRTRERIHRNVADLRLLAIPASWGRIADPNPNWGAV